MTHEKQPKLQPTVRELLYEGLEDGNLTFDQLLEDLKGRDWGHDEDYDPYLAEDIDALVEAFEDEVLTEEQYMAIWKSIEASRAHNQ